MFPATTNAGTINKPPYLLTLRSGLVAHWTFDGKNMTGGVTRDISGQGNNGGLVNIATTTFYAAGKIGQGLKFDGSDDLINTPNIDSIESGNMSFSLWIKPNSVQNTRWLFGQWASSQGPAMIIDTDGSISFEIGSYVTGRVDTASALPVNTWTHITATASGNVLTIYINGAQSAQATVTRTESSAIQIFTIGGSHDGLTAPDATLDDMRVYSRALSATEIAQLYKFGAEKVNTTKVVDDLRSGLVGHWTFDGKDAPGGRINDVSGSGNNGSTSGISTSTFYSRGKIGQGGNFDGVDDYVDVGNITSINSVSTVTYSAWIKLDSLAGTQTILGKWNGSIGLFFETTSLTNGLNFGFDGSGFVRSPNNSLVPGEWTHVVGVFDNSLGTGKHKIYINGVSVALTNAGSPDAVTSTGASASSLQINRNNSLNRWLKGSIDDVRVYNRALSATEVAKLYGNNAAKKNVTITPASLTSGLIAHWTFDGKNMTGGVARDISGQGNNGGLVNIATTTFYAAGKIGQGLRFDGVNDRISLGGPALTTTHSFSFWIKPLLSVDGNFASIIVNNSLSPFNGVFFRSSVGRISYYYSGHHNNNTNLTLGEWYHVVISVDAGNVTFYLNGVADGTHASATAWTANKMGISNFNEPLNATLDDMRIYNRALSASEAAQLYNLGK